MKRHSTPKGSAKGQETELGVSPADKTYEVGYRKPPRAMRFKPGQSGNPKGRPKTNPTVVGVVHKALWAPVQMRVGDKVRRVSRLEAMMMKLTENSLKGDAHSTTSFFKIASALGLFRQPLGARLGEIADTNDGEAYRRLTDGELNTIVKLLEKIG